MSFNTFGHLFRVTTWGESHGPALGATVDGCPPGVTLEPAMIQHWLDKRRPGQNRNTTQRQEPDTVEILSGVFEGVTTGTPIQLMIRNADQRSKDYGDIAQTFRPGHADITYHQKYGLRDYRGGGRSSARETAARVAAGGVAREVLKVLAPALEIKGYMIQMGPKHIDRSRFDWNAIDRNDFWCPDPAVAAEWEDYLDFLRRKDHNSVGATIEMVARGVPAGIGAPVYGKLDTDLAAACMSINAVKGVEIGEGMAAALLTGRENADEIFMGPDGPEYGSNHAGGILGGISTGQDIVVRFAVKPTSSILSSRASIRIDGTATEVVTKGRHDPCVGIRAVPVGEAMMACVILDHILLDRGQTGVCVAASGSAEALQEALRLVLRDCGATPDAAHDLAHAERVWRNAAAIARGEGVAPTRVLAAAYLHDIVTLPKDHADRRLASRRVAEAVRPILAELGFDADEIDGTAHAIAAHSYSAGIAPESDEARILQDADRIEALGAIGLARVFAVSGALGRPLFDPDDPFARDRPLDDTTAAIDHFAVKLLRLPETMQTATGRKLAQDRAGVLRRYLVDIAHELGTNPPDW